MNIWSFCLLIFFLEFLLSMLLLILTSQNSLKLAIGTLTFCGEFLPFTNVSIKIATILLVY